MGRRTGGSGYASRGMRLQFPRDASRISAFDSIARQRKQPRFLLRVLIEGYLTHAQLLIQRERLSGHGCRFGAMLIQPKIFEFYWMKNYPAFCQRLTRRWKRFAFC